MAALQLALHLPSRQEEGRADGKRQIPAASVLFQGASWKVCSLTSAYISIIQNCVIKPLLTAFEAGKCVCAGGACGYPEKQWNSDGKYFEKNCVIVFIIVGFRKNKINELLLKHTTLFCAGCFWIL